VNLKRYYFLKVLVVDDVYDDNFNEDEFLHANDDDIDDDCNTLNSTYHFLIKI